MIDQDDVLEALSNVIDPELGLDFVELGLVYGVEIDGGTVNVTFTLTTPACPIGPQVSEQMQEFVGELPGVRRSSRHGLHARVDPGQDVRGREVRARLLARDRPNTPQGRPARSEYRVVSTNLASAEAVFTETPAVTGCPVHWVADLATSEPATVPAITEGGPDPKEVREFFELYKEHSTLTDAEWRLRVGDVVREIAETGTYTHTTEELTVGARLAWRHNTRASASSTGAGSPCATSAP